MKNCRTLRVSRIPGIATLLLTLMLLMGHSSVRAQAGFSYFYYTYGSAWALSVCENSAPTNIDTALSLYDANAGNLETWSIMLAPAHGSLSLTSSTGFSTGFDILPSGWAYTPTSGYSGGDTFVIHAGNGADTATMTFYVTVNPLPVVGAISGPTSVCVSSSITLTCASSGGYWAAGNANAAVSTGGVVTGVFAGTDPIMYILTNACGNDTGTQTVTINPAPTAPPITYTSPSFCVGGSSFLHTANVAGYTYQWYDGASAISGATDTAYTATTAGNFSVRITNATGCFNTSAVVTTTVSSLPINIVSLTGSSTFCAGGSALLSATTGSGFVYQWLNSGVGVAGATNSTYSATASGDYRVRITSSVTGCTDTTASATTITVNPAPAAAISASGPLTFCPGSNVVFTAPSGTGYTYQWYGSSGVIGGATAASYTATSTGNYSVVVTNSYPCSATSSAMSVTVSAAPAATVSPSGTYAICHGTMANLTAPTGTGYVYQWYNGSAAIAGATTSNYSTTNLGSYKVRIVNATGCVATSSVTSVVSSGPAAAISASGSTTFCSGTVTLRASTGSGYSWQWYRAGAPITGATGSTYTTGASGSYAVVVTESGCGTLSAPVTITNLGAPTIIDTGATTFCEGGRVMLTVSTGSTATTVYQWKRNSINITGATNSTYFATSTGNYSCYLNIGGTCIATTATESVTVHPAPVPVISFASMTFSTATGYSSYQWQLNGVNIAGATNRTYMPGSNGNFTVVVTDARGCSGTSAVYLMQHLAVANVNAAVEVRLYPNPANSILYIESSVGVQLTISCMDGKVALQTGDVNSVDISSLPTGIYMATVFDANGNRLLVEKLIKE